MRGGAVEFFLGRYGVEPVTVVVAGASGLVGSRLVELLEAGGHRVRTLVRRAPQGAGEFFWDPEAGRLDRDALVGAQAVVHLGGAPIGQPFRAKNKRDIFESRVRSTDLLAGAVAELAAQGVGPQVLVCASAVGFYGADRGREVLVEDQDPGSGFLAEVCQAWEAACQPAVDAGVRVVQVRTGLVLSAAGGMLGLQLPLFRAGLGGWVGSGRQVQSWIGVDDIAAVYLHAVLTEGLVGPVNAVAPSPVSAKELAQTVGAVLGRPVLLPIPPVVPALLLGREGVRELALASQWASAEKLLDSGFEFFAPSLRPFLEGELGV